jgi:hypothetical protein
VLLLLALMLLYFQKLRKDTAASDSEEGSIA